MYIHFTIMMIAIVLQACGDNKIETKPDATQSIADHMSNLEVPDLPTPSDTFFINAQLNEISGLYYDDVNDKLLTINDEKGYIYYLDPMTGALLDSELFSGNGDYEGIEMVDSKVYVINSKGDLFVKTLGNKALAEKIKTELSQTNDVEGLGYDSETKELLLACKAQAGINGVEIKNTRAIYRYSIEEGKLDTQNILLIREDKVLNWFDNQEFVQELSKAAIKELKKRIKKFAPSAISKHPITGYYYILSSRGKLLIVLSQKGEVIQVYFLNDGHAQPEGLCFTKNAKLYISNEAAGLQARIFVFDKL